MPLFNRKQSKEFVSEMPEQYEDDEEYYGEEEEGYGGEQGYFDEGDDYQDDADDDGGEDDEDGESEAPRSNVVKAVLVAIASVLFVGATAYFAATAFAPDLVNDFVNNLPFVSQSETSGEGAPTEAGATADGDVAPPPTQIDPNAASEGAPPEPAAVVPPKPVAAKPQPKPVKKAAARQTPFGAPQTQAKAPTAVAKATKPVRRAQAASRRVVVRRAYAGAIYPQRRGHAYRHYGARAHRRHWRYRYAYAGRHYGVRRARHHRVDASRPTPVAQSRDWVGTFGDGAGQASPAMQWSGGSGRQGDWVASYQGAARWVAPQRIHHRATAATGAHGRYLVQVGAFADPSRASQLVSDLRSRGLQASAVVSGRGLSRVYVGRYRSRAVAAERARQLQRKGLPTAVTAH